MEKNKKKNMRPLWEAAKKTVDGGIKELRAHIEEKRRKKEQTIRASLCLDNHSVEEEQTILKLEVLERDLTIISMVSNSSLKTETENIETFLFSRNLTCTSATTQTMSKRE